MTSTLAPAVGTHPAVSVLDAEQLSSAGALVLDVREDSEWAAGHAPQALHVPLATLRSARQDPVPRGRTVLVVCRSGFRSGNASALLAQSGYDVLNVAGGMIAWREAGLPVVTDAGVAGHID